MALYVALIYLIVLSSCSASGNRVAKQRVSTVKCTYTTESGEYTTELPYAVIQKYGQNTNKK